MRLKDRVAIVVGAGQSPGEGMGNGRATALTFAREGAKVLCVDHNLKSAEETVEMIGANQGTAAGVESTSCTTMWASRSPVAMPSCSTSARRRSIAARRSTSRAAFSRPRTSSRGFTSTRPLIHAILRRELVHHRIGVRPLGRTLDLLTDAQSRATCVRGPRSAVRE
jgi:NAD(P)-dependent dehydrogenase (short-subunit alcohol dehydrogenase family)